VCIFALGGRITAIFALSCPVMTRILLVDGAFLVDFTVVDVGVIELVMALSILLHHVQIWTFFIRESTFFPGRDVVMAKLSG